MVACQAGDLMACIADCNRALDTLSVSDDEAAPALCDGDAAGLHDPEQVICAMEEASMRVQDEPGETGGVGPRRQGPPAAARKVLARAHGRKGAALARLGQADDAILHLRASLAADPSQALVRERLLSLTGAAATTSQPLSEDTQQVVVQDRASSAFSAFSAHSAAVDAAYSAVFNTQKTVAEARSEQGGAEHSGGADDVSGPGTSGRAEPAGTELGADAGGQRARGDADSSGERARVAVGDSGDGVIGCEGAVAREQVRGDTPGVLEQKRSALQTEKERGNEMFKARR